MDASHRALCHAVMLWALFVLQPASATAHRLLFVGNSLTYSNDLPTLVEQAAARRGITVDTTMLAKANYAIVDHWAEGFVQELIQTGQYDYVIIQQGPSSQSDGRHMLINGGQPYSELTTTHGARLAYLMVWPSLLYYHTFDGVIANYTAGAEANEAILIPVGQVWKDHFDATGDYSYYGADGFHPARKGSQVAAEVIVDTLFADQRAASEYRQVWLTGLGQISGSDIEVKNLFVTEGGGFVRGSGSGGSAGQHWGSLSINFDSCHTGQLNYRSSRSAQGVAFGQGHHALYRLAMNRAGEACEAAGGSLNSHLFMAGSYHFGAQRTGEGLSLDVLNEDQVIVTWYTYLPSE